MSTVIFNVDEKIKARAMKRAKEQGVPFAAVLKSATKAFAEGRYSMELVEEIRPEKLALWEKQSRLMDQGKGTKFASMKAYREWFDSL